MNLLGGSKYEIAILQLLYLHPPSKFKICNMTIHPNHYNTMHILTFGLFPDVSPRWYRPEQWRVRRTLTLDGQTLLTWKSPLKLRSTDNTVQTRDLSTADPSIYLSDYGKTPTLSIFTIREITGNSGVSLKLYVDDGAMHKQTKKLLCNFAVW